MFFKFIFKSLKMVCQEKIEDDILNIFLKNNNLKKKKLILFL